MKVKDVIRHRAIHKQTRVFAGDYQKMKAEDLRNILNYLLLLSLRFFFNLFADKAKK